MIMEGPTSDEAPEALRDARAREPRDARFLLYRIGMEYKEARARDRIH
jgi:hypothetical protein